MNIKLKNKQKIMKKNKWYKIKLMKLKIWKFNRKKNKRKYLNLLQWEIYLDGMNQKNLKNDKITILKNIFIKKTLYT